MKRQQSNLAILTVGLGAVSTTLMAGVMAVRRGWAKPIGSLSQYLYKESLSLSSLNKIAFGAWDILSDDASLSARNANVLEPSLLRKLSVSLRQIRPMAGLLDKKYLRAISGNHVKSGSKWQQFLAVRKDVRTFCSRHRCSRAVVVLSHSTEVKVSNARIFLSWKSAETALRRNDPSVTPTMIYAWAALSEGASVINATPNNWGEAALLDELCQKTGACYSGSDLKTGQTLLKSIIAPGLRARLLGVHGWFSTNILGNRDGKVLEDPGAFKSKESSKKEVLSGIFSSQDYPDLYGRFVHKVTINYYEPRGDNKEGWDNIDLFGWLGYPMQLKINFLCRDSILAAPLVLDLALFIDLAGRRGLKGAQSWLGFYFKSPISFSRQRAEHDLFKQWGVLQKTLEQWRSVV